MIAIKNVNGFQNFINERAHVLKDMINVINESEKELDVGVMEKLSEIYLELTNSVPQQEFSALINYFKDCSDVCSYCVSLPDNPKANRKVIKILVDGLELLEDIQTNLEDKSTQFKVMQKVELANSQLNRLSRSEFYSIWKERQKAS